MLWQTLKVMTISSVLTWNHRDCCHVQMSIDCSQACTSEMNSATFMSAHTHYRWPFSPSQQRVILETTKTCAFDEEVGIECRWILMPRCLTVEWKRWSFRCTRDCLHWRITSQRILCKIMREYASVAERLAQAVWATHSKKLVEPSAKVVGPRAKKNCSTQYSHVVPHHSTD